MKELHKPILLFFLYSSQETLTEAMKYNDQLKPYVNSIADDLNPLRVQVNTYRKAGGMCLAFMSVGTRAYSKDL